jgi:hypothetical protein
MHKALVRLWSLGAPEREAFLRTVGALTTSPRCENISQGSNCTSCGRAMHFACWVNLKPSEYVGTGHIAVGSGW